MPNPAADFTVEIVAAGADQRVTVVADQVLTATPADVGKVVTVDADGQLVLGAAAAAAAAGYTLVSRASAERTGGNLTISSTSWATLHADLVLTLDAEPGDFLEFGVSAACGAEDTELYLDAATIVASNPVSWASGINEAGSKVGVRAWLLYVLRAHGIGGSVEFPNALAAGDIVDGQVTVAPRCKRVGTAASKTVVANSDSPFQVWAKVWRPPT